MFTRDTLKRELGVDIDVSTPMMTALKKWSLIYVNTPPWIAETERSLNLGASIASEIARAVTIEMQVTIEGGPRAKYLSAQMEPVLMRLREKVELGNALGGMMLKPFPRNGKLPVDFVGANSFYPVAFDSFGNITACIFADRRKVGNLWYTRLEYHKWTPALYVVRNAAYKSLTEDQLGGTVPLAEVADWAEFAPETTIVGAEKPLFAYFRFPGSNVIDPASPLGVSCFARAVHQLEDADDIYNNLRWEFKSGKRKMYVDELAIKVDPKTKEPMLPKNENYIRTLAGTGNIGDQKRLFDDWSPEFREAAINSGLNSVLKRIEFLCGLAYGTLSDPQSVDKTATEILSAKQRSAATVTDTQKSLQSALDDLLYAMDVWCDLERLAPTGTYAATYDFDDSLVTDEGERFSKDMQTKNGGMMPGWIFLMRNYDLDEATAKQWIAEQKTENPLVDLFEQGA